MLEFYERSLLCKSKHLLKYIIRRHSSVSSIKYIFIKMYIIHNVYYITYSLFKGYYANNF